MKPFAAEQAHPDLLLERDANRHALGRAEERVLLTDQLPAQSGQVHRQDTAGVRRGERDALLAGAVVREDRHEEAFTRQDPAAGAEQRSHQPALRLGRAVAEDRLHGDAVGHVHHRAGLGHGAFAGIELHLDELHVLAEDLEVDLVRLAPATRNRRRRRRHAALQVRHELRHRGDGRPVGHAGREDQRVAVGGAILDVGDDFLLRHRSDLPAAQCHEPLCG